MSDAVEKSFLEDVIVKTRDDGTIISIWPMDCVYSDWIAQKTHCGKYRRVQSTKDAGDNANGDSSSDLASTA